MSETARDEFGISGQAYTIAVAYSQVPTEQSWPEPRSVKAGRGYQYWYPYSDVLAEQVASHLDGMASASTTRRPDAVICRTAANNVRYAMRRRTWTKENT